MQGNKDFKPRDGYYPKVDGKFVKPERSDAYLTVVRKRYENGGVTADSWYHYLDDIESWAIEDGMFKVSKHDVRGRHQVSFHPLSEILRIDFNGPSKAYFGAFEGWTMQEYSLSYDDWQEMQTEGKKAEQSIALRRGLAEKLGVPIDDVVDLGDGQFGVNTDD